MNVSLRRGPLLCIAVLWMVLGPLPTGSFQDASMMTTDASATVLGPDGGGIEYAIITTSGLKDSFLPLRTWKGKMGLRSEVFILDGPGGILQGTGRDDAEKLNNFITSLYDDTEGRLRYVLLGGDSELVPTRYLWAGASKWDMDDRYISDVYYSCPGLDWDHDGDGRFGERGDIEAVGWENLSFALAVGRVPASTAEEASRYVQRVIDYETGVGLGGWTERFIMASSLMDRPNITNDPLTEEDEGYDAYKDNGYKAIHNYTLNFIPMNLDIIELQDHPSYEGGNYNTTNDTLGFGSIAAAISGGCSLFTFAGQSFYGVNHGVSPPLAYSLAQWIDPSGTSSGGAGFGAAFTHEDAGGITNGMSLPVMYISSCDSANFSDAEDRDLSNIIFAEDGGAICLVGSSGISWRGEGTDYSLGNWYLLSRYWQRFMVADRPGDALYELKAHYLSSKSGEIATKESLLVGLYAYNYIGDPSLQAWAGEPAVLKTTSESTIFALGDFLEVTVRNQADVPVSGAAVSVYEPGTGEVFGSVSGPDGTAHVWTNFTSEGAAVLTVKGKNFIPHFENVTILKAPADILVENGSLEIWPLPLSEDRQAWANVTVRNIGGKDAAQVKVGLFLDRIPDDPSLWPSPFVSENLSLEVGEAETLSFRLNPARSWTRLTVGAFPPPGETRTNNNIASMPVAVNAKPRFIPFEIVELDEDAGGKDIDLKDHVYDPDNEVLDLKFSLGSGAPPWTVISNGSVLSIDPPSDWSGALRIVLIVSDGLATDDIDIDILVRAVNDAPIIIGLKERYTAQVDAPFSLSLEVQDEEGDSFTIEMMSDLDRLALSGSDLRFIPYPGDEGNHTIYITVSDPYGANSSYSFILDIASSSDRLYFKEPSLHLPDAVAGERYRYKVEVGGDLADDARFEENSSLFDIDPSTGEISFEPIEDDVGEHWVRITVTSGDVAISRSFILEIRERREIPAGLYWGIGITIALLCALLVIAFIWKGPKVEQYGLEE